jgi:hypothetical protein
MQFNLSSAPVCSKTRRLESSANLASRIFEPAGKSSVEMAYALMLLDSEDIVGECVRRWMWRLEVAEGTERAM